MRFILAIAVFATVGFSLQGQAACQITDSKGSKIKLQGDALFLLLSKTLTCPQDVFELKSLLKASGAQVTPSMVANRGRHNLNPTSFSIFESVTGHLDSIGTTIGEGEFFFGHFTTHNQGEVVLDQKSTPGSLMIELIVWDVKKKLFNFYELIGNGQNAIWFYRGDSADALSDNQNLFRDTPEGQPKFGSKMRCSACHVSGGPIMKELTAPFNDWWSQERPLAFSNLPPSKALSAWLTDLEPAESFSNLVESGIEKLERSPEYQKQKRNLSLQEQLRPLFCETEINLESDLAPLDATVRKTIDIPSGFFVNPLLAQAKFEMPKANYHQMLLQFSMIFPESFRMDADHAWLVPVKGRSDQKAIESLIAAGIIDQEFALDVLSIDFETPVLSKNRCSLLKLVPAVGAPDWQKTFVKNLSQSNLSAAKELAHYLTQKQYSGAWHRARARSQVFKVQSELLQSAGQLKWFKRLLQARTDVTKSEISMNPRGQILEPGFRVIFPRTQIQP